MPKVKYDTNTVNGISIPTAKKSYTNIQKVCGEATAISFPEGDFGWGSIPGKLQDVSNEMNKYATWITSIDESIKVTNLKADEELVKIKFEDIKSRTSIVK